jgi:hypothetical protein
VRTALAALVNAIDAANCRLLAIPERAELILLLLLLQISTHEVEAEVGLMAEVGPDLEAARSTGGIGGAIDRPFRMNALQLPSAAEDSEA